MTEQHDLVKRLLDYADIADARRAGAEYNRMSFMAQEEAQTAADLRACVARIEALESRLHSVRAAALEEAAVIAETWFDHHRPQQPKKSRFNIYDIEHWAKSATRLVAEDIRALAGDAP